mmetsp:Transcript_106374/g.216954  ORF Transcript_106374/g.216954 Transcript_106374/m.216954 type:complete len:662 (+) Transcript_106374:595-2580(+)
MEGLQGRMDRDVVPGGVGGCVGACVCRKDLLRGRQDLLRWDLLWRESVCVAIHFPHCLVVQRHQDIVVDNTNVVFIAVVDDASNRWLVVGVVGVVVVDGVVLSQVAPGVGSPLANVDTHFKEDGIEHHLRVVLQRRGDPLRVIGRIDADLQNEIPGTAVSSRCGDLRPSQVGRRRDGDGLWRELSLLSRRNQDDLHHPEHRNGNARVLDHPQFLARRTQQALEADQEAVLDPDGRPALRALVLVAEAREKARDGEAEGLRKDVRSAHSAHPRYVVEDMDALKDLPAELLDLGVPGRYVVDRPGLAGLGEILDDSSNQVRLGLLELLGKVHSLGLEAAEAPARLLGADVGQDVPKSTGVVGGSPAGHVVEGRPRVFAGRRCRRCSGGLLPGADGVHHVDVQRGNVAVEGDPAQEGRRPGGTRPEVLGGSERVGRGILFRLQEGVLVAAGPVPKGVTRRLPQGQVLFHVLRHEEVSHCVQLLVPDGGGWWRRGLLSADWRHAVQIGLDAVGQAVHSDEADQPVRRWKGGHVVPVGIVRVRALLLLRVALRKGDLELQQQVANVLGSLAQRHLHGLDAVRVAVGVEFWHFRFDKGLEAQNGLPQFYRCAITGAFVGGTKRVVFVHCVFVAVVVAVVVAAVVAAVVLVVSSGRTAPASVAWSTRS